ncbi:hypothetical protein [Phytoactinopolyspora mesophila]|uniref:Uncharacterized protein n=1 Tax=Phytoactinopolyspora mesophila TaxID=2650750 RepID=A0A7K3M0M4_9ACTN|nr:hypothetical protein [Phytoactinopolyspora mesophila]NDL56855.1 hypothetical protein [Phytoactinopolyspora mesophila]
MSDAVGRRGVVRRGAAGVLVVVAIAAGGLGCTSEDGDLRGGLARALTTAGEAPAAGLVDDEEAELTLREVSFLTEWELVNVLAWQVSHPPHLYIGHRNGTDAAVVSRSTEAFDALVAADGSGVPDEGSVIDLVTTRAEVVRPQDRLVYVVHAAEDIEFRADLDGDDERRRQQILQQFGTEITPPRAVTAPEENWLVTLYVVDAAVEGDEHRLELREIEVGRDGSVIGERADVIAEDLPLPYYMR